MSASPPIVPRNLVLVLGDQLDRRSAAFDGFCPRQDAVWMAENQREATHVWCHKLRLAFFFSAMRHFRDELRDAGNTVHYHQLQPDRRKDSGEDFVTILAADVKRLRPKRLIVVEPGDHRVWAMLRDAADNLGLELETRPDRHFYCGIDEFRDWADGRKSLVLETFYRHMRKKHGVLLDDNAEPAGGAWNFDHDNREAFGKGGPPTLNLKAPRRFQPDDIDDHVVALVQRRFGDHPGNLDHFDLPRTRRQAVALLREFIRHRLGDFGRYEDAMWRGEPFLYHSRLSAALNVKLLDPRECVEAAVAAYHAGEAPINSVEGFVRQIIGWREFIRGVYWLNMPEYARLNALQCDDRDVPGFFWDGQTDMACVADAMRSVIDHGYTHHIQRLMVLGQFALLLGVHPRRFHDWHMAMYLDAIDWVSLPNALGMSQYGDGGTVGTKPYCASGAYINRMSNYCRGCRYRPTEATGEAACPFTTLYWDFLARHHKRLRKHPRMVMQVRNLERKKGEELSAIRRTAGHITRAIDAGERI
jgi:deoxyribodipyrimidine photolyase-related protein